MDLDQRLGWLALWLKSGFQKPLLSKTLKPICITSGSVHKRRHAIWFNHEVKQEGMRSCNFAVLCFVECVLLSFQVFRPVAKSS